MDVPEVARLVGLAGMPVIILAAVWLRRHPRQFQSAKPVALLVLLAMLTGASLYVWLVLSWISSLPRDPLVGGALAGWMFAGIGLAVAAPVALLLLIADRDAAFPRPGDPVVVLWTSLAGIVGSALAGILWMQMLQVLRWSGDWAWVFVPPAVAVFPLVPQLFWAPAVVAGLRRRQRTLEPPYAGDLRAWVAGVCETYRLERIQVLFGPAKEQNAAAVGFWPMTRFIMLGDGLTTAMPVREVRAVLAHEVAHVLRNDVRNQTLLSIALASMWVYVWVNVSARLNLDGPWWAVASGLGCGCVVMLSGMYSRRCELAADRLAAELIEDPAAMGAALTRLSEMTKTPADHRSPTHPSLSDRLTALGLPRAS